MTVEADIFRALKGLVGNRVYPEEAPAGVELPFIIYQQVGGDPLNYLAGVPDKRNGRFQIDVWASNRTDSSTLSRQAEDILRADPVLSADTLTGMIATKDPATGWRGSSQDFSIWFTN
ncbi:uncharacterized protein DUF3168 [Cupriavidus metallidurans]|jgi:hypothetical protein|uniref:DUF3168 domain-containing protein n=1 Tax=Cupriavidus TaxID=106589 RepID=UPI0004933C21|nr:DUF3168 domain-containing protein [Cupriavidus metallidurans]MDE4918158.1 DUF3168 domain-containing protein [Cupriavidus metallidurans]